MKTILWTSFCAFALPVAAQTTIYVPDNAANAGTCNVAPFGNAGTCSAGCAYVVRVPANLLDPMNPRLVEVSVAPCGTGTWTASTIIIAAGHVPNPLPLPFSFPVGGSLGSFLDLTVIWDSTQQGSFAWSSTQDTWSPLGFAAGGGTGFCWDGVNDIGYYLTFQPATVTGWNGGCHRTGTEPFRAYAAGYQAAVSTTSGASGMKLKLDFSGCGPSLFETNSPASSLDIGGVQGSPYAPAVTLVSSNTMAAIAFASTNVGVPFEAAIVAAGLVPAGGGALMTANGQLLNVDLGASPIFLNGGPAPSFSNAFPGNFSLPFNVGQGPYTATAQMLNFDPFHPDGYELSQGVQLSVQ